MHLLLDHADANLINEMEKILKQKYPKKWKKLKTRWSTIKKNAYKKEIRKYIIHTFIYNTIDRKLLLIPQAIQDIFTNASGKESIYMRFWAAKALVLTCSEKKLEYLLSIITQKIEKNDKNKINKMIMKTCALAALVDSDFALKGHKPLIQKYLKYVELKKLPQFLQVIVLEKIGEEIPQKTLSFLLERVEDRRVKILLEIERLKRGNLQALRYLKTYFQKDSSQYEYEKSYILWAIWSKKVLENIPDSKRPFPRLYKSLYSKNFKMRTMASQIVGNICDMKEFRHPLRKNIIKRLYYLSLPANEQNEVVRYYANIALIRLIELKTLTKIHSINETLFNQVATTFFLLFKNKKKQKIISQLLSSSLGQFLGNNFSLEQEYFKMVIFGSIATDVNIKNIKDFPPYFRTFFEAILFKSMRHPHKMIRLEAARAFHKSEIKLEKIDKKVLPIIKNEKDKETQKAFIGAFLYQLKKFALSNEKKYRKLITYYEKKHPKAVAYGYYKFIEKFHRDTMEGRLFKGSSVVDVELHYLQHLRGIFYQVFQNCRSVKRVKREGKLKEYKLLVKKTRKMAKELDLKKVYKITSLIYKKIKKIDNYKILYFDRTLAKVKMLEKMTFWVKMLSKCVKLDPTNPRYNFELSYHFFMLEEYEKARIFVGKAIALSPKTIYIFTKALYLYKKGMLKEAERIVEKLIEDQKIIKYEFFGLQGKIYLAMKKWKKAEKAFTRQYMAGFFKPQPLIYRSLARFMLGEVEKARGDFRQIALLLKQDEVFYRNSKISDHISIFIPQKEAFGLFCFLRFFDELNIRKRMHKAKQHIWKGIQYFKKLDTNHYFDDCWIRKMPFTKKTFQHYGLTENPFYTLLPENISCFFAIKKKVLWDSQRLKTFLKR